MFATSVGTKMSAGNVRRDFRRALALVPGIDPSMWTPRELRHSFVSLLSDAGVPLEEISQLVGHSGTTVTEQVYRHQLKPVIQTGATVTDRAGRCYSVCYSDPLRGVGRLANRLVKWVGLSGLEPLTSALSGEFMGVAQPPVTRRGRPGRSGLIHSAVGLLSSRTTADSQS